MTTKQQKPTGILIDTNGTPIGEAPEPKALPIAVIPGAEPPVGAALDARDLRRRLEHRQRNRDILMGWIRDNLQDGVDYGRIHVKRRSECDKGKFCTDPYHWSKPSLWKPGAEKICGMLGWSVAFPNLEDYTRMIMAGRVISAIVLRCELVGDSGKVMGEGIGARDVQRDEGDLNKALKMAKKSAHIDATLVAAGLSEVFTQDMGDEPELDDGDAPVDQYAPGTERGTSTMGAGKINTETHCPIGKEWKGVEWGKVDSGYLSWLIDHVTDKPDIVKAAQKELDLRQVDQRVEELPRRPEQVGSMQLSEHAREIVQAKTLDVIDAAWSATPEKFRPSLKKTYEHRREALVAGGAS